MLLPPLTRRPGRTHRRTMSEVVGRHHTDRVEAVVAARIRHVDRSLHPPRAGDRGVLLPHSSGLPAREGNQAPTHVPPSGPAGHRPHMLDLRVQPGLVISAHSAVQPAPIGWSLGTQRHGARSCSWSASSLECLRGSSVIASPTRSSSPRTSSGCSSSPEINATAFDFQLEVSYTQPPVSDRGQAGDDRLARPKCRVLRWQRGSGMTTITSSQWQTHRGSSVARPREHSHRRGRRSACRRRSGNRLLRMRAAFEYTMIRRKPPERRDAQPCTPRSSGESFPEAARASHRPKIIPAACRNRGCSACSSSRSPAPPRRDRGQLMIPDDCPYPRPEPRMTPTSPTRVMISTASISRIDVHPRRRSSRPPRRRGKIPLVVEVAQSPSVDQPLSLNALAVSPDHCGTRKPPASK